MADEAPSKSHLVAETFGKVVAVYDNSPSFSLCGTRLVALVDIPVGARVLDIASGTDAVLFPAAERVGRRGSVIGIDLTEPMVASTTAAIRRRGLTHAEVHLMNAEALQFAEASFDRVTCGFALWYIPDLHGALREMHRVLRPGGRLAVSTWGLPNDVTKEYTRLLETHGGPLALGSQVLTSADAVQTAVRAAGFEPVYAAEETVTVLHADEQQWWSQRMPDPQLRTQALTPADQERLKSAVRRLLQPLKTSNGIPEAVTAVFVVAVNPS